MTKNENNPGRKSRTNWLVLLLNAGAIIALLFSYLATYVKPSDFGYFALFGLAFPLIFLVNLLFVFYWFFKKRKWMWLSLVAILFGWNQLSNFFQISLFTPKAEYTNELKVLTYNVRLFGIYNDKEPIKTRDKIFDLLDREQADVICFQEFYYTERKGDFKTKDTLLQFLPNKYYHERYTHALSGQRYFGVALFSKYPIVRKGAVPFSSDVNNFCIYADIKVGEDTVRVYSAHLQSIRFKEEDYALMAGNKNQEKLEKGGKRIARRLTRAFTKREEQVNRIVQDIQDCPYKVVLCGDFNDTPVSYAYATLTRELKDSFIEAGNGIGNTYIGVFPSFRIDYVLHSKDVRAIKHEVLPEKLSDHHAVTATLAW